jgi:hypothetical protein
MSTPATGKCLCGTVRFTATGFKPEYHACHCGMCRRWSGGSPFFAVGCKSVTFDSGADNIGRFRSSDWAERGFCKSCGTTLFYFLKPTEQYSMSVGTFDDPALFKLASEIFIDHKPSDYALAGDRPRLTEAEVFAKYAPPT